MSDELTIAVIVYILIVVIAIFLISKNEKLKDEIRKYF